MRSSSAFQIMALGVLLLLLAVPDSLHQTFLSYAGVPEYERPVVAAWISTGLAAMGFVLLVAGLFQYFSSRTADEFLRPYREALASLAAEHGQSVDAHPTRGVLFSCVRDGQRMDVHASPREDFLVVTSPVVARQPLAWQREGAEPDPLWTHFKAVGSGRHWELRGELPALARALLEDRALTDVLDSFFGTPEGATILHRREGLELRARLAPAERFEAQVRNALELAYRVRRSNG